MKPFSFGNLEYSLPSDSFQSEHFLCEEIHGPVFGLRRLWFSKKLPSVSGLRVPKHSHPADMVSSALHNKRWTHRRDAVAPSCGHSVELHQEATSWVQLHLADLCVWKIGHWGGEWFTLQHCVYVGVCVCVFHSLSSYTLFGQAALLSLPAIIKILPNLILLISSSSHWVLVLILLRLSVVVLKEQFDFYAQCAALPAVVTERWPPSTWLLQWQSRS